MRAYLAGPMRGYEEYNFPAFREAAAYLRSFYRHDSFDLLSPAEHDEDNGFDPTVDLEDQDFDLKAAFAWDIEAVCQSDMVFVLDDWEQSKGASIEVATAWMLRIPVYTADKHFTRVWPQDPSDDGYLSCPTCSARILREEYEGHPCRTQETITDEAYRLVYGDRGVQYGSPDADFERTGQIWGAVLNQWRKTDEANVPAKLVALCMAGLKVAREVHRPKRDNLVDGIGYLLCAHRVETGE